MESTPRPVWRKLPRPVFGRRHEQTDEDHQRLDDWRLVSVDTRMDDALAYLQAELVSCGVDPAVILQIAERVKVHLLAEWAKDLLYGCCECLPPAATDKFLWAKFGVQIESRPINDATTIVAVAKDA